jgi:Uma2 family endonuclease
MAQETTTVPFERSLTSPPAKMTYEEFLAWADEDTWAEWVDGEVMILMSASEEHQDLADFLTALLRLFTEAHQLGIVRSAPFQMKTGPDLPGREPDIIFVAREHLDRLKHTHLDGPADLVVEIVSPESRARDRGTKFYEYEQGGIREYWLLDPLRRQAEFYGRGAEASIASWRWTVTASCAVWCCRGCGSTWSGCGRILYHRCYLYCESGEWCRYDGSSPARVILGHIQAQRAP